MAMEKSTHNVYWKNIPGADNEMNMNDEELNKALQVQLEKESRDNYPDLYPVNPNVGEG